MLRYVSIIEQKEYSKIQHEGLDDTIDLLITAKSAAVKNYLGDFSPYQGERNDDDDFVVDSNYEPEPAMDSSGLQVVRSEVKLAVLLEVDRHLNPNKYGGKVPSQNNYLSDEAVSMLYPLRDPGLR